MTATSNPHAGTERDVRPVLHDAVEAMLATARRLAMEAKNGSSSSYHETLEMTSVPCAPCAAAAKSEANTNLLVPAAPDDDHLAHPVRAVCYAAGAGALFSFLLRKS